MQATGTWPKVGGLSRVLTQTLVPRTASCYPQAGAIGGLFPPHHNLGLLGRFTAATFGARLAGDSPGHASRDPPLARRRISVGAARSIGDTKSLTPDDANRPGPRGPRLPDAAGWKAAAGRSVNQGRGRSGIAARIRCPGIPGAPSAPGGPTFRPCTHPSGRRQRGDAPRRVPASLGLPAPFLALAVEHWLVGHAAAALAVMLRLSSQ